MPEPTERTIELQLARLVRGLEAVRQSPGRRAAMDRAVYLLLERLADGPRPAGQLAAELHLDQSTVSRQLAALERQGLSRRVLDPAGGRAAVIELSPEGERVLDLERAARADRVTQLLRRWNDRDRRELARLLARLNDAIDERMSAGGQRSPVRPAE